MNAYCNYEADDISLAAPDINKPAAWPKMEVIVAVKYNLTILVGFELSPAPKIINIKKKYYINK